MKFLWTLKLICFAGLNLIGVMGTRNIFWTLKKIYSGTFWKNNSSEPWTVFFAQNSIIDVWQGPRWTLSWQRFIETSPVIRLLIKLLFLKLLLFCVKETFIRSKMTLHYLLWVNHLCRSIIIFLVATV